MTRQTEAAHPRPASVTTPRSITMHNSLSISEVRFSSADPKELQSGLLGFLSLVINRKLKLDGITLRQTRGGKLALSFPARRDRDGRQHSYVQPLDHAIRTEIEQQVFAKLPATVVAEVDR